MTGKPLYFLTHEGNPSMFSGYGIPLKPLNEGDKSRLPGEWSKSPLVGMLMVDRPERCPEEYLQGLRDTFGEVMLGPITTNGDRGIFTQMRIEDPLSLSLVREDLYCRESELISVALELGLKEGHLPGPRLRLSWSPETQGSGLNGLLPK
jgi:hypothetical protein